MEFAADAPPFRRLWEVQLKPLGGLFLVGVVVEAERVDGVFAYGIDAEGTIC